MTMTEGHSWSFGEILSLIITIIVFIIGTICVWLLISSVIHDLNDFKEYKNFCKDRPSFCYCNLDVTMGECSYKTSYTNGVPSKDTKDLCDLATKLKDKEMIFKSCQV